MEDSSIDESQVYVHFHDLSFTFPISDNINDIDSFVKDNIIFNLCIMLGYDPSTEVQECSKSYYNFEKSLMIGSAIYVRYGGEYTKQNEVVVDEQTKLEYTIRHDTCMVEFKGSGVDDMCRRGRVDFIELFEYFLYQLHGSCTRLDMPIDLLDGSSDIKVSWIWNHCKKVHKWCVTPFRDNGNGICKHYGDEESGETVMFGNRGSKMLLDVYDKKAERFAKKDETFRGDFWTRFEMRFFKERANLVAFYLLDTHMEDLGKFAREQLLGMLDIKVPFGDSHLDRRKTEPAWLEFLDCVKGRKFTLTNSSINSIEKKMTWRDYSMTRQNMILDLSSAYEGNDIWIDSTIARAVHEMEQMISLFNNKKFAPEDLVMINTYREKHKLPLLKMEDVDSYMENMKQRVIDLKDKYKLPF